jgi:hypothetical protein
MANFIDPLGNREVQRTLSFARARERYSWVERETLLACCEAPWETAVRGDPAAGDLVERFDRSLTLLAWTHGWTRRPADLAAIRDQAIPLAVLRPFMAEGDARTRLERLTDPAPEPAPRRRDRSLVPRVPFVSPVPVAAAAVAGLAVVAGLGKTGAVKVGPLAPSGHAEEQKQKSEARQAEPAGGGEDSTAGATATVAPAEGGGPVGDWFSARARAVERITRDAVDRVRHESAVAVDRQTAEAESAPAPKSAPVARPAPAPHPAPPVELVSAPRADAPAPAEPSAPAAPSLRPGRDEHAPGRGESPRLPTGPSADEGHGESGVDRGGPWEAPEESAPLGLPGRHTRGQTSAPDPAGTAAPAEPGGGQGEPNFTLGRTGPARPSPATVPGGPAATPGTSAPTPGASGAAQGGPTPGQGAPGLDPNAAPPANAAPGQPAPAPAPPAPAKPAPAEPQPAAPKPAPAQPQPAPAQPRPAPAKPTPAQPAPAQAAPAKPQPAPPKPAPAQPAPASAAQAPTAAAPAAPAPAPAKPAPAPSPAPQQAPAAPAPAQ